MSHLFIDISSHGFGHLAQVAPILGALRAQLPALRLTIRCGLPETKVRSRIPGQFSYVEDSSDFGFAMRNAVSIDLSATAERYQTVHATWLNRVDAEARFLDTLRPDLVLTDVAYLPLAAAARVGIPAMSMCSLNWADLFTHFFGGESWAAPIHAEMLAAYCSAARFLRLTPAMPMLALPNAEAVGPVASLGTEHGSMLRETLRCERDERTVLIAFGGVDHDLRVDHWPEIPGVRWLVPQIWNIARPDMAAFEPLGFAFTDLLASVDAVLTKPGYGTFVEAACNRTAILYQRRKDWPEQDCLIEWLKENARCHQIEAAELAGGHLRKALEALWTQTLPPVPLPSGIAQTVELLRAGLKADSQNAGATLPSQTAASP